MAPRTMELTALSPTEARELLEALQDEPNGAMFALSLRLGLRPGEGKKEATRLRVRDIDDVLDQLADDGLSRSALLKVRRTLSQALRFAVKREKAIVLSRATFRTRSRVRERRSHGRITIPWS